MCCVSDVYSWHISNMRLVSLDRSTQQSTRNEATTFKWIFQKARLRNDSIIWFKLWINNNLDIFRGKSSPLLWYLMGSMGSFRWNQDNSRKLGIRYTVLVSLWSNLFYLENSIHSFFFSFPHWFHEGWEDSGQHTWAISFRTALNSICWSKNATLINWTSFSYIKHWKNMKSCKRRLLWTGRERAGTE